MTKAELEAHANAYFAVVGSAKSRIAKHQFKLALADCAKAWPSVVGMMQYIQKFEERAVESVEAFDLVLQYTPLAMSLQTLDSLDNFLNTERRRFKNTIYGSGELVTKARKRLWDCHRLWGFIADSPGATEGEISSRLWSQETDWNEILKVWRKAGLLTISSSRSGGMIHVATRLGALINAKCPNCGATTEAPKGMFLEPLSCGSCHRSGSFVLLGNKQAS